MMGRIRRDDVDAALTTEAVLDRFGVEYRDGRTIKLRECPKCKRHPRRVAFRINRDTGMWIDHAGPGATADCKGDLFDLVAAFAGLDVKTEFPRVLEFAAEIAGVRPDTDRIELDRRIAEHRAERARRDRERAAAQAAAHAAVPGLWESLDRRNIAGERYLESRGLDPAALRRRGDVVRYWIDGAPAVLLHDLDTSAPINILRRQLRTEPKVMALDDCSTHGTLVGKLSDIDPDGSDVAVIAEGLTDSLAACLAFPTCAVFGANGSGRMARVGAAAAARVVAARGWMLVAVDDDEQGIIGAGDAIRAAITAGLVLDDSLIAIDTGTHKDLAAAWAAGWRWQWPRHKRGPGGAA